MFYDYVPVRFTDFNFLDFYGAKYIFMDKLWNFES